MAANFLFEAGFVGLQARHDRTGATLFILNLTESWVPERLFYTMTQLQSVRLPALPEAPTNSVDGLLGLRAFACLMVLVTHCAPPAQSLQIGGRDLSWLLFSNGFVAVWIFFALSGYLMGKAFFTARYPYNWQGIQRFWWNRALRILPLYSFSVVLLAIFVYPEILKMDNWGMLLRVVTFTYQSHIQPDDVVFNGALWSLSTEVQFYLIVPLIYGICRQFAASWRWTVGAIVGVILAVFGLKCVIWLGLHGVITTQMSYALKYWYSPLPTNLDVFLIGFLLNPLLLNLQQRWALAGRRWTDLQVGWLKFGAIGLIILFYLLTAHHLYFQEQWNTNLPTRGIRTSTTFFLLQPLTALCTALFIVAFELTAPAQRAKLTRGNLLQQPLRMVEILGHLSYGIYVWHSPIIHRSIGPVISITDKLPIELFYHRLSLTLLLSGLFATVTYGLVERPALSWKRSTKPPSIKPPVAFE
jgi:peptidoglycan/LPS O-acetylase OafA/YrhL